MKIAALIARILLGLVFVVFWTQWLLALYERPLAFRSGGPIPGRTNPVAFRSRSVCGGTRGWRATAGRIAMCLWRLYFSAL